MANTAEQKNQLARINRKLAPKYEKVLSSRSDRENQYLGDFYVLDSYQNAVINTHVNLDDLEAELAQAEKEIVKQPRSISASREEALTMRLVEQFTDSVYPFPWEFSEEEIDCIAGWEGIDDKGTFGSDDGLVAAYDLNVALGENTYPKFAEILRGRKAKWDEQHRAEANLRRGERLLEAAVDACIFAGMSKGQIAQQVEVFSHLNGQ